MYTGASTEMTDEYRLGKSGAIVVNLMQPHINLGHNVFSSPIIGIAALLFEPS